MTTNTSSAHKCSPHFRSTSTKDHKWPSSIQSSIRPQS